MVSARGRAYPENPGVRPLTLHSSRLIAVTPAAGAAGAAGAATAAAVAAGPGTVLPRLGLVDRQGPALKLGAVELLDGLLATLAHLDKAEPAGAAGFPIVDDLGPAHGPVRAEQLKQVVRGGFEGEVSDVNLLAHGLPLRTPKYRAKG